jgi:hypothetical protein
MKRICSVPRCPSGRRDEARDVVRDGRARRYPGTAGHTEHHEGHGKRGARRRHPPRCLRRHERVEHAEAQARYASPTSRRASRRRQTKARAAPPLPSDVSRTPSGESPISSRGNKTRRCRARCTCAPTYHIYVWIEVYYHARTHTRTHKCTHARTHAHAHKHARTHARTHTRAKPCSPARTRTRTHAHTWLHARAWLHRNGRGPDHCALGCDPCGAAAGRVRGAVA